MAFLNESVQYALQQQHRDGERQGALKVARFSYTHPGPSDSGEINLVKLPPGRLTVLPDLSWIVTSSFGANAELSVGYREYRQEDGVLVEADGTFLLEETAGPLNDP